jgi:acetoin utilization deacetylase AcuC-like enzyme
LEAGATDAVYAQAYAAVSARLEQFAPELLLISAGYDAHEDDPLAAMRVTTAGYAAIVRSLRDTAARIGCPIALVTEGGYDLKALADCTRAVGLTLGGDTPDVAAADGDTTRAAATCAAVVPGLRARWTL